MRKPFICTLMEYLEETCPTKSLPIPVLEWLEAEGYSVAIVQNDSPILDKSYINGSCQFRVQFEVIAQGNISQRLDVLDDMQSFLALFYEMVGETIGDGIHIRKVEATTPSLRNQTDNLTLQYGMAITIVYKD